MTTPLQASMEAALAESPDDLASHAAYADLLHEQGDPRGDLIQTQLALESPSLPPAERERLRQREAELLAQHAAAWLGDAGRFLVGPWSGEGKPYYFRFARGWLDAVRTLPFPEAVVAALARSPEARLLRRLEVVYDMRYHPFEFDEFTVGPNQALRDGEEENETYETADLLPPLLASPHLGNLRVFKFGFSDEPDQLAHSTMISLFEGCTADQVVELLQARCPRVEELYLNTAADDVASLFASPALGNLRVLQYYYGSAYTNNGAAYPLAALAGNPWLQRLTTLRLHPGRDATLDDLGELEALLRSPNLPGLQHLQLHMTRYGDAGCRLVAESGVLRRLKTLDLGYGNMTDDGASLLAACPDLRHLQSLTVSRNALTAAGIAALQEVGIAVTADEQHEPDNFEFLYEVDME